MLNKPLIPVVVFLGICVSVFSQDETDGFETDNFIEGIYWYRKYLPQENISEYYALKNTIEHLKENDTQAFEQLTMDLSELVHDLTNKVHESLQKERQRVSPKMKILVERYGSNEEVMLLAGEFAEFEDALENEILPADDSCLAKIDELYSRLITRLGYVFPNGRTYYSNDGPYEVKEGDYLRKIAAEFYDGNELLWRLIYEENKDNSVFLPDPQNPDLIYPGTRIRIPPKPPELTR
jgi:hypothetical protein